MMLVSGYLDLRDANWSPQLSQHGCPNIKNTVNQGCMSLSTYYLEYGRHLGQRRRRRRHRRAYAHTSNIASHDNHEEINSWPLVSFSFLYEYGAPLAARTPLSRWSFGCPLWMQSLLLSVGTKRYGLNFYILFNNDKINNSNNAF